MPPVDGGNHIPQPLGLSHAGYLQAKTGGEQPQGQTA